MQEKNKIHSMHNLFYVHHGFTLKMGCKFLQFKYSTPDTYDYAKLIILPEGVMFVSLYSSIPVISTTLI